MWEPHAANGWHFGPAMKHYRSGYYFIRSTCVVQVSSTNKLLPTHCSMPSLSEDNKTVLAAEEFVRVLEGTL